MNMNDVLKFFGFKDSNFDNYIIDYRLNYQRYNKEVAPHYSNHFENPHLLRYITTTLLLDIFNNLEYLMYCDNNHKYGCKPKQVSIFVDTKSRFMVVARKLETHNEQPEVTQAFRVIHKSEWTEWKGFRLLGDYSEVIPPLELGEGIPIKVNNPSLIRTKDDFSLDEFKSNNIGVVCSSSEARLEFLKLLRDNKVIPEQVYISQINWKPSRKFNCYIMKGQCLYNESSTEIIRNGKKVITYNKKEELSHMTKNDLKSGMRVVVNQLDSYYQYMVLKEAGLIVCMKKTDKGYLVAVSSEPLCNYTDDLVNKYNSNLTIMRIYYDRRLVWERDNKDKPNKDKPLKLTPGLKVEVQDMYGWLPAVLVEYDPKQSTPFQVLLTKEINNSSNNKVKIAKYKYCRLASNQKALFTEEQAREEFKARCSMTKNCRGCNPNKQGRGCCDAFIKDRIQIIE